MEDERVEELEALRPSTSSLLIHYLTNTTRATAKTSYGADGRHMYSDTTSTTSSVLKGHMRQRTPLLDLSTGRILGMQRRAAVSEYARCSWHVHRHRDASREPLIRLVDWAESPEYLGY